MQESEGTTRRLAVMNLAFQGIEVNFWPEHAETFPRDLPPDIRTDYVLANGSTSSNQSGEGGIRKPLIEIDLKDCMGIERLSSAAKMNCLAMPS